jgi:NADH-quinone oxidoreductase subunit M
MSGLLLPVITFLPLLGALALMVVPREEEDLHRGVGFATTLATFLVSLLLLADFQPASWSYLFDRPWIDGLGIRFKLGVDGISLWLVLLTTFLMPIVIASAWTAIHKKVREFMIALLVLETGMVGAFVALDLFTFYVFWEVMLIPMYFIIGIWGGDRRLYASIKFVIYTMVGSLLMIVAILYLATKAKTATGSWTFDYDMLRRVILSRDEQLYLFLGFALAFLIKVPLFPLHTWLPDAHVEAPTAGSVILASVLLKFGGYGMLRFAMPMFPQAVAVCAPWITWLAVIGIVYGSLVAWAQTDVKKLVAYSSVAHLGFVVLGLMAWNVRGVNGAMMTMLAHGISTGGLFLAIGVLYERRHTRRIDEFGGIWSQMPRFASAFMIITLASVGLPGLSGFVGEFMILLGSFDAWRTWDGLPNMFGDGSHPKLIAAIACSGVILGAVYMLWMFQKVMFGENANPKNHHLKDLNAREVAVFVPIVLMAFWLGIYPSTFLSKIDPAVNATITGFRIKYAENPDSPAFTPRLMSMPTNTGAPPPPRTPTALPNPGALR